MEGEFEFYFWELFMVVCSYLAMCVGYYNRKKFKELEWFFLYPLASFLQVCFAIFIYKNPQIFSISQERKAVNYSVTLFSVLELLLIYNFFIQAINSESVKKSLYIISLIFLPIALFHPTISETIFDYSAIEALCALIPCYFYFQSLMKKSYLPDLKQSPVFWVAIAITVYFSCTFPLFVLKNNWFKGQEIVGIEVYSINYIFYSLLFLAIARAYMFREQQV